MPAILAEPCVGATNPVKSRIVVVLPAPLGPRKATTSPLGMENVTSRTARNDPNCLLSPSASIMTGFDILLRSSAISGDKNPCTNSRAPHCLRSVLGTIKEGPAGRRGTSLARHSEARNPHNRHYEDWLNVFIMRRPSRLRNRLRAGLTRTHHSSQCMQSCPRGSLVRIVAMHATSRRQHCSYCSRCQLVPSLSSRNPIGSESPRA